jgi:hypothetical protein
MLLIRACSWATITFLQKDFSPQSALSVQHNYKFLLSSNQKSTKKTANYMMQLIHGINADEFLTKYKE